MKNVHPMTDTSVEYNDSMLPLYVVGYHTEDNEFFSERKWSIRAGPADVPLTVELTMRVNLKKDGFLSRLGNGYTEPRAFIESREVKGETRRSQQLFPLRHQDDGGDGAIVKEDVTHRWLLYGPVEFCMDTHYYQAQPGHSGPWFPATIRRQMAGGMFEAVLTVPGAGGLREVVMPGLTADQLRETKSRHPLERPMEREFRLHVPAHDPLQVTLTVNGPNGLAPFWQHLAIFSPSPTRAGGRPFLRNVDFQVSKDRQRVRASASGPDLKLFLTDEVRAVCRDPYGELCQWTVRVGPYTEHNIEVVRWERTKSIVVKVDGEVILSAPTRELVREEQDYALKFVIYRVTCLVYHVYETNRAGDRLDTTGTVREKRPFFHQCEIRIPQRGDIHSSTLTIDGCEFEQMPRYVKQVFKEPTIVIDADTLRTKFGLWIPHKVNHAAPAGLSAVAHSIAGYAAPSYLDRIVGCCSRVEQNEEIHCFPTHKVADEAYTYYGMNDHYSPYGADVPMFA